MTLTVRSATVTGATTKGSALTHAELDENFNHLRQSSNHTFTPSGSGATSRTLQEKVREIEVSVNDFSTVQAAIDAFKPAGEAVPLSTTVVIKVPDGDHEITSPINLYSGVKLRGNGGASKIVQGAGFSGTALVLLKGQGANAYNQQSGVEDMGFECSGSVWAIKQSATTGVLRGSFTNLFLDCGFGIDLGTYAQDCTIDEILSNGSLDQLLHLKGNNNKLGKITKEGGTGSSTDPYILIEDHGVGSITQSNGNTIEMVLIEGTTSANKSQIKLLNCKNTTIGVLWLEPSSSDGYGLRIEGCFSTLIKQISNGPTTTNKIKIDTSQHTKIEFLDLDGSDSQATSFYEIDSTSTLDVDVLKHRRGNDTYPLSALDRNITIRKQIKRTEFTSPTAGQSPIDLVQWMSAQNLAQNPSFEAGRYGWTFSANPDTTEEYITSEVGSGLMGHFEWSTQASRTLLQNVTVPANMPVTLTALVKIADGTGWITPRASGVGVTHANGTARATTGSGWQLISRTVIPTSAGTLSVGLDFVNAIEVYVDEFNVHISPRGLTNSNRFASVELGGKTQTYASAAPTGGTWKAGDFVWNTAPSIDASDMILLGWSCTSAGSPGTWSACYASNVSPAT